ncbi:MAG TPA: hypothetical protein VN943_00375 [Candidatus Acidoferrum sp.]|nr:hypothetical protein [Candidatus Acidoferrum sp.]
MQIVDRYLQSVKTCLPEAQADDIIKELSENISSQIEDKEGEFRRRLSDAEIEAILKQHGHPLLVASRYRQEQRNVSFGRQIIGPALFPFYIRVLKFNLGLTSVVLIVIFAALFASGQPIGTFPQVFLYQLLIQFAIVTLIFWLADQHFTKFPDRWDPRKPYGVRHPALIVPEDGPRIPRAKPLSQLIALAVALLWLRAVQHSPFLIFGPAAAFLSLSPAWARLYVPIVAMILLGMIHAGVNLIRPDWMRFHWLMSVVTRVGELVVCYFLIRAGSLVVSTNASGPVDYHHVAQIVSQAVYYGIWITAAISIVQLAKDLRRLASGAPRRAPVGQAEQES